MKKLFLILCIVLNACSTSSTETTGSTSETQQAKTNENPHAVIYVAISSHNEEPSINQPDYTESAEFFEEHRAALVDFANMLYEEGVKYNWQTDWNFLKAIQEYDEGSEDTNGKNVAVWMEEDLGFETNPHAHESKYTYADVAYLMELIGLHPAAIVGGFLAAPISDSKVDYINSPIEGNIYDTTWTAEASWGGGTGLHIDETGLWTSGIWRPASANDFFMHDPNSIPNIGNFSSDWEGLDKLLEMNENGELDPEKMYTITIMNDQKRYVEDGYIEEFRSQIEKYQPYAEDGTIAWVTFGQMLEIWEQGYNSEPNILHYDEEASKSVFDETNSDIPSNKPAGMGPSDLKNSNKPFKKNL